MKALAEVLGELSLALWNPQRWTWVSRWGELCVSVLCVVWVCLSINSFRKPLKLYLAIQSKHALANMIYATGDKKKNLILLASSVLRVSPWPMAKLYV